MKKTIIWVLGAIVLAFILVAGMSYLKGGNVMDVMSSSSGTYQSVFLVNGQVYFGKLSNESGDFMTLRDVYYLQVNQAIQPAAEGQTQTPDISLVKLGGELHGPTDEMRINSAQVLLIEDLKSDSNVVRAIAEYKKSATPTAPKATN